MSKTRPKTAPEKRRGESATTSGRLDDKSFSGGKLKVSIFHAEKYIGNSRIVFGQGSYPSRVEVFSLEDKLTESIVNHGGVDDDFKWAGYEDDFKVVSVTNSPIVRFVIYDCERRIHRQPLGLAMISLQDIPSGSESVCMCTVPIQRRSDMDSFDPKAVSNVGTITFSVDFVPYSVKHLEQFEQHEISTRGMKVIRFGFGWGGTVESYECRNYSAAVVMFDKNGNFLDAVSATHARSKKGPHAVHRLIEDKSGDGFADVEAAAVRLRNDGREQQVSSYFLVIYCNDRIDGSSLHELNKGMYVRVVNGDNNIENCRFTAFANDPSSSCIMARVVKDPDDSEKWLVRTYGQLAFEETFYGDLIPEMKDLLGDAITHCKGSVRDVIKYAWRHEPVHLTPLLQSMVAVDSTENPNLDDENTTIVETRMVPMQTTDISLGINSHSTGGVVTLYDIGCLMLDSDNALFDVVHADKQRSNCGSVLVAAPLNAADDADITISDEKTIQIFLNNVPENVKLIAVYICAIGGDTLRPLESISGNLFETESKRDVIFVDCNLKESVHSHCSLLLCAFIRKDPQSWFFVNVSELSKVSIPEDNLDHATTTCSVYL